MERFKLLRWTLKAFLGIRRDLQEIQKTMATKADLENAIAAVNAQVQQLGADVTKAITDLEAKIAAGAPPEDTQPLVDEIKGIGAALTGIDTQVQAADGVPPVENQTA